MTEAQRELNISVQGTVTLRVEFLANGQIGKATAVNGLPYGLTENAVEAAKKVKFIPATKEGNPITIFKQLHYFFTWDGGWENTPNQAENIKKDDSKKDEKAESIIKKAVEKLGGDKYLQVKSQIGRGRFSILRDNVIVSFQSFVDVIVFPDKERTEFKGSAKNVQTNVGKSGWIFDGDAEVVKEQDKAQIEGFERGINASLDNLLRGGWRNGGAVLSYVGKRQASLGKRNDVVKLVYTNGFTVEFEFTDDGTPAKSIFKRTNADNEEITEEDRYAQFVEVQGIKTPFIIDRFTNKAQSSRINYDSVEFNRTIPDSIFAKPKSAKEVKKDLKL
ncbi:MAG: energy transducer TonB [Acidobacteriota bacterium]|nr:energy transducer TonB [Acidobacteriota bacterium]